MKRLFLIFGLLIFCVPTTVRADQVFGLSPAKIEKTILVDTQTDLSVQISRSESGTAETFQAEIDSALAPFLSFPQGNMIVVPGEQVAVKIPIQVWVPSDQAPEQITGIVRFSRAESDAAVGMTNVRYALGMRVVLHVVHEPTMAMRAQKAEGEQLATLWPTVVEVKKNETTQAREIWVEVKNTGTTPVKEVPVEIMIKSSSRVRKMSSRITSPIEEGSFGAAHVTLPELNPGVYHIEAKIGEHSVERLYRVWPIRQLVRALGWGIFTACLLAVGLWGWGKLLAVKK